VKLNLFWVPFASSYRMGHPEWCETKSGVFGE